MRSISIASLLGGVAMICLAGTAASAATAPHQGSASDDGTTTAAPSGAGSASGTIETVIVTAEKRSEDSQKVPVALTAVDGNMLDSQGIHGFEDLSMRIPSLRFGSGVTGGENVITLRGLGSQNTTPGGDSPVAYNVNGVDAATDDGDRPGILRRAAGRGAARAAGHALRPQLGRRLRQRDHRTAERRVRRLGSTRCSATTPPASSAAGSTARSSTAAASRSMGALTAVSAEHSPIRDRISRPSPARPTIRTARTTGWCAGNCISSSRQKPTCCCSPTTATATTLPRPTPPGGKRPRATSPRRSGSRSVRACDFSTAAKFNPRVFCHDAPETATNTTQLYSATLNWELPWADFTSVTAYERGSVAQVSDGDGSNLPIAIGAPWTMNNPQFSQEFRLASRDSASPIRWLAGFIYFYVQRLRGLRLHRHRLQRHLPAARRFRRVHLPQPRLHQDLVLAPFGQMDFDLAKTHARRAADLHARASLQPGPEVRLQLPEL